ncbi:Do family serine endopeptidase [Silvanigrella paludirubra]|uniref:Do family serine endopeptidase n=1 Tax=Silvanigrella paludirubra TaxID=2499159 RepID=A0A6N6VRM3_9BACT|nr:Do family serine endopeptidase [Silvanigrella paludirubra]KAB8036960.1 Do family serine endopeptidase [Silvanigrella paludirubra]
MNSTNHSSKKVTNFMKARAKNIIVAGVSIAALFGVASAGMLILYPNQVTNITQNLTAQASNGYSLPSAVPPTPNPDSAFLKSFKRVFSGIAKESRPALVFITAEKKVTVRQNEMPFPEDFFFPFMPPQFKGPNGQQREKRQSVETDGGSGFIVDLKNGYIITNNHVIEGADKITVTTYDNRKYKAKVVGTAKNVDISVLKLEDFKPSNELKQVSLANSDEVEVGDWAIALGAPFELPQTLTMGVVSAVQRSSDTLGITGANSFIQTDAAINPGNSGGPLVNLDGQVIGMNTAIYSKNGTSVGIGFAIPSNTIRLVADSIINNGKFRQVYLGVEMYDLNKFGPAAMKEMKIDPNTEGALVMRAVPKSPAAIAGLKPYDIIQSVNNKAVKSSIDIQRQIIFLKPGTEIKLGILREGKTIQLTAKVAELPGKTDQNEINSDDDANDSKQEKTQASNYGLMLSNKSTGDKGVLIAGVQNGSPAAQSGLRKGDVILKVNKQSVSSPKDVEEILKKSKKSGENSPIFLLVARDDGSSLAVILPPNS